MTVDFASFTPMASLVGGVMIGVAALLLMLLHGRVMGISGILGGIVQPSSRDDLRWRLLFVAGALLGPLAVIYLLGRPITVAPVASGSAGSWRAGTPVASGSGGAGARWAGRSDAEGKMGPKREGGGAERPCRERDSTTGGWGG